MIYQTPGGQRILDKQAKQREDYAKRVERENEVRRQLGETPRNNKAPEVYGNTNIRFSQSQFDYEGQVTENARLREQERRRTEAEDRANRADADAKARNDRDSGPAFRKYWTLVIAKAPKHERQDALVEYSIARNYARPGSCGVPNEEAAQKVLAELRDPRFLEAWADAAILNYVYEEGR